MSGSNEVRHLVKQGESVFVGQEFVGVLHLAKSHQTGQLANSNWVRICGHQFLSFDLNAHSSYILD